MERIRRENFWDMVRIRDHFLAFDQDERLKPSWSLLSEEEGNAIASLATDGGQLAPEPPAQGQLELFASHNAP